MPAWALDALRQDELACEQGVAALDGCCPDETVEAMRCVVDGCAHATPDLSEHEANCATSVSCAELKSIGFCEALEARLQAKRDGTFDPETEPSLCQ